MEEYETLGAFLEHVSLVMDNDADREGDKVTIMTIHAAKGLEFDTVFLAGWEEGVFPSQRALDEGGLASLEEERRLAYVAITRARRSATILHAANRRIYGQWTSSHPQPLRRRAARGAYRAGNHHDRRREPVARQWTRARRPLRPRRPAQHAAAPAAPAGSAPPRGRFDPTPQRVHRGQGAARSASATRAASDLALGQRVFHGKFGYGTIAAIEGNKLEIDFEHAGRKRVLDSFVSAS